MVKAERPEEGRTTSLSPHLGQGAVERPQTAPKAASAPSTAAAPSGSAAPPAPPKPPAAVEERAVGQPGRMAIQGEGKRMEVSPGAAAEIKRQAEELVKGGRTAGGSSSTAAAPSAVHQAKPPSAPTEEGRVSLAPHIGARPVERPAERAEAQRPSAAKPAEEEAARGMRAGLSPHVGAVQNIRKEAEELVRGGEKVGGVEAKAPAPAPQPPQTQGQPPSGGGPEGTRINLGPRGIQQLRQAVKEAVEEGKAQKTPQGPQGQSLPQGGQPPQPSGGQPPSSPPRQTQSGQNRAPQIPPNAPDYVRELVNDLARNGIEVLSVKGGPAGGGMQAGQQVWTVEVRGPDGKAHTITIRNVVGQPAPSKYLVSSDVFRYTYGVDSGGEAAAQFLAELVAKGTPPPAPQGIPQNLPDYVKRTIDFLKNDRGLVATSVQNLGGDTWRIVVQRSDGSTADIVMSPGSMGIYEGGKLLGAYTWSGGWGNFDPKAAFYTSSAAALRNVNPTAEQLLSRYREQGELAALLYSIANDPNAFADASLRLGAKIASVDYAAGTVKLADGRTLKASIRDGVLYIGDTPVAKVPEKLEGNAVLAGAALVLGQKILSNIDEYLKDAQTNAFGVKLFEAEGHKWLYDPTSGRLYLADSITAQQFWRAGPVNLDELGLPEVGAYGTSGARFLGLNASGGAAQAPPTLDVLLDVERQLKEAGIPYIVRGGRLYVLAPPDRGAETLTLSDGSKVGLIPVTVKPVSGPDIGVYGPYSIWIGDKPANLAAWAESLPPAPTLRAELAAAGREALPPSNLVDAYLQAIGVQPVGRAAELAGSGGAYYAPIPKTPPPSPQMIEEWAKATYGYNTQVERIGNNTWVITVGDALHRSRIEAKYDPTKGTWSFKTLTASIDVGGRSFEVPMDEITASAQLYTAGGDLYAQAPNGAFYKLENGRWVTAKSPFLPMPGKTPATERAVLREGPMEIRSDLAVGSLGHSLPSVGFATLSNGQVIQTPPNAAQIFDLSRFSQQVERSMAGGQIPPVAVAWTADGRAYIWYKGSDRPVEVKAGPGGVPVATWVQDGVEYGLFLLPPGHSYAFAGKVGNAQVIENLTSTGAPIVMVRTADGWMPVADPAGNINESALQQAAQYYGKSVESLKPQWQQIMDQFAAGLASTPLGAMGKTLGQLAGAGLASLVTGKPFSETYAKGVQAAQQMEMAVQGTPLYTAGQAVGWGTAAAGALLGGVSLASEAASASSLAGAASVLARNLIPSAAVSGALAAAEGGSPEDIVKSALIGMALAPAMGGIGPKAALAAAGAGAGAGALTYLATGSPQLALGAGADVGFLSLMAGGLASLGKGEVTISRDEIEAVAKAAGKPVRDVTEGIKKTVERLWGTAEDMPGGGLRVVLEADRAARALAREAVDASAPPGKAPDVFAEIMRQASAGVRVDPYKAALDAGLPEADAAKFAEAYKAYLSTLVQNVPSLKDRLAALGGEEAAGARTSVGEEVRKAVASAVDAAKTAASQILGTIKSAKGAVEEAVVRPAVKAVEEVGKRLASLGRGAEDRFGVRALRWLARNVDEPLSRGNLGAAVDKALDVVRAVDRIRELEGRPSLSEAEARELNELRLRAALNNYYRIYDALRELRPSIFESARARLAEERLAEALRELGGRGALDRLGGVLTPEELESLARNIDRVGRDVLVRAALGDRDALDRLASELGMARDKVEYVAKEWAASHLRDVVEAMDAAEARSLLSDRAKLAEAARAFGVREEDLQAMVEEALEAKMRAAGEARGGVERSTERPRLEVEERGVGRPKEEGGGREVRTGEGQALLLKEEAEARAEEEAREEERGAEERGAGGLIALLRPEAVKEEMAGKAEEVRVAGAGLLLKERAKEAAGRRAATVPYVTPLRGEAGRLGEELRMQLLGWRIGELPYTRELPYTPFYAYGGGGGGEEVAVSPYVVQGASTSSAASVSSAAGGSSPPGSPSPQQTEVQQPQQAAAAVSPYVMQGAPQLAAEEAPPPPALLTTGWPWYPAEGGGGGRYRPGRQRERLVL